MNRRLKELQGAKCLCRGGGWGVRTLQREKESREYRIQTKEVLYNTVAEQE